jgi:hypothetical protein
MSASSRFHWFVTTSTITVMYWVLYYLGKTFPSPSTLNIYSKTVIVYIGSVAFYQLLASSLRWLFDHVRWVRRKVLGPEYLEGTWIGCFAGQGGEKQFTVEHFEQTLDGIVIRGYAQNETNALFAQWTSKSVAIDSVKGTLTYSYDCDLRASKGQGLAMFMFQRKDFHKPPGGLVGYSADLVDGIGSPNTEYKLSDAQVILAEAMEAAKKKFK